MRFADVVGHARPIALLRRALATDRLAHALLFAGPEGIGKRLVADALAAAVVCETKGTDVCGACPGCRQLAAGTHPDVLVVSLPQGKREVPIERVRDLNQFLRLQPLRAARKAAIIDDAHLLSLAAQNALLKGLEEPPLGALMILIAHNADALLPTVRSRCQRLLFAPLSSEEVDQVLRGRLGIAPEEIAAVAPFADGRPGRALALRKLVHTDGEPPATRLERLEGARYGALVPLATHFSRSEDLAAFALESLLRQYRDTTDPGDRAACGRAARRADIVVEALQALRRRNPNRQLLLESVFLQLARR
jgi:DNA polymerase-3 subunit delta'